MKNNIKGTSIAEFMVGIFISSLLLVAIIGSVSFYMTMKRSAIHGNSAFSNAISALYMVGSDLKQAGLGLSIEGDLACDTWNAFYNGTVLSDGAPLIPLQITGGAGNNPDQISIMFATSVYSGAPSKLVAPMDSPDGEIRINHSSGGQIDILALLSSPQTGDPCTLTEITNTNVTGTISVLSHAPSLYNPNIPTGVYSNAVSYPNEAFLINVGMMRWVTWRLNNNNELEVLNNLTGAVDVIAEDIVQLQAEYGITNGANETITDWVEPTGAWANLTPALIKRIRAIRVTTVARSKYRNSASNGNGVCTTTTANPTSWPGSPNLDVSQLNEWQCYRYRVLRNVFPLKNLIWGLET